jgi:hypothetical protein
MENVMIPYDLYLIYFMETISFDHAESIVWANAKDNGPFYYEEMSTHDSILSNATASSEVFQLPLTSRRN